MERKAIPFVITKHLATIRNRIGMTLELNIVEWSGYAGKLDLRQWRETEEGRKIPCRGFTLTDGELARLITAAQFHLAGKE